jgi:hypothetical protein
MAATSFATWLPRHLPTHCPCHLWVMWQVNPWRSLSSQILSFGLGSMGFTPIYDGLRTSWITLIHDKNLRTSREGIRDAQYMTFSNFVHEIFCSESYCLLYQHSFHFPSFVQIIDIFLWIAVLVMKKNEKSKLSYSYYIPLGTML